MSLGHPAVLVVGVDEVGRGCLAGPVVAGAVILPAEIDPRAHAWLRDVNDSKKLTAEARERLVPLIEGWALASAIGVATVDEIDRLNIHHASHLAMKRAIEALRIGGEPARLGHILVDGKFVPPGFPCAATAVVKGDSHCLSIAAASILAKVWRDRHMVELEARFPGFGFAVHKGYGTPLHLRSIAAQGICELHRRSFAPVAMAAQGSLFADTQGLASLARLAGELDRREPAKMPELKKWAESTNEPEHSFADFSDSAVISTSEKIFESFSRGLSGSSEEEE